MSGLDLCRCGHDRDDHNASGCTASETMNVERHEIWGGETTGHLEPEPCECEGFELGMESLL